MTLFIWPFLVGLGKVLFPQIIRTVVPVIAGGIVNRFAGPPQSPQQAATYDEEDIDEYEEVYEDEDEEEYE